MTLWQESFLIRWVLLKKVPPTLCVLSSPWWPETDLRHQDYILRSNATTWDMTSSCSGSDAADLSRLPPSPLPLSSLTWTSSSGSWETASETWVPGRLGGWTQGCGPGSGNVVFQHSPAPLAVTWTSSRTPLTRRSAGPGSWAGGRIHSGSRVPCWKKYFGTRKIFNRNNLLSLDTLITWRWGTQAEHWATLAPLTDAASYALPV